MAETPSVKIGIGVNTGGAVDGIIKVDSLISRLNASVRQLKEAGTQGAGAFNQLANGARQAGCEINKSSSATAELAASLRNLNAAAGGFVGIAAIRAFAGEVVTTAAKMDGVRRAFQAIGGDAKSAGDSFAFVTNVSKTMGLDLQSAASAFAKLQASAKGTALEGQPTRDIFLAVSKAAASLGLSSDEAQGALLAISQMMSKGTVQAEELRGQLGERLPGTFNIAAKAMGVTTAELGKMLEKGQVVASEFLPKFSAELEKTYSQTRFDGIQANLNNLGTAWTEFKDRLGKGGLINPILGALQAQVEQASEDVGLLETLGAKIGGVFQTRSGALEEETRKRTEALKAENELTRRIAEQKGQLADLTKQRELAALGETTQADKQSAAERIKAVEKLADARRKDIDALVEGANKAKEAAAQARQQADEIARDTKAKLADVKDRPELRASAEDALRQAKTAALDGGDLEQLARAQRAAQDQLSPFAQNFFKRGEASQCLREVTAELDKMKGVTDPKAAEQAAAKIQSMAQAVQNLGGNLAEASDQAYFIKAAGKAAEDAQRQLATLQDSRATEDIKKAGELTANVSQLQAQIDKLKADAATIPIDVQIEAATKKLGELQAQLDALPTQKTIAVDVSASGTVAPAPVPGAATGGFARVVGRLPGFGGGDRFRALLEAGEFVVRKEAVQTYGPNLFAALNALAVPRMASGGAVARAVAALPQAPRTVAGQPPAPVHLHLPGVPESFALQGSQDVVAELQRVVGRLAMRRGRV